MTLEKEKTLEVKRAEIKFYVGRKKYVKTIKEKISVRKAFFNVNTHSGYSTRTYGYTINYNDYCNESGDYDIRYRLDYNGFSEPKYEFLECFCLGEEHWDDLYNDHCFESKVEHNVTSFFSTYRCIESDC